ncbi:alpha-ketoacid dehydrogenase subunit beta [Rhodococcus sp. 15-2388-1-1a]|uniref:alpha-ketoacid dehydrogenase subunit beta n=1 Tax=Nocardiaceae TaxID=85025 RepID=UPI000568316B|nr:MULTISPECIES: alpha-ketoacid dehydrogenase subunit beta [Rhodococcus]OZE93672.1 alpha-ketoacid dehydrogenase subunit beta [Rhodococcus sp. 15-2388-1-1a]
MSTATETPESTATAPSAAGRVTTYVKAYNEAVAQVMREDDNVFVAGEDVAAYGGVFHMYDGLLAEFGSRRMVDTPIAEMGLIGLGVGAAARGLRPIIDIMFMDFLAVALDQVVNQAAKMKFMYGGEVKVPMVIAVAYGAGVSAGAQHSQSLEAWLAHTPGLKVVMPSNAYDAKGLMVSAVRDDNPVVFMLNKVLLGARAEVPEDVYAIPLGEASVARDGEDVTIVAFGRMVSEALKAADILAESGVSVEVVDPRTVQPLDTATIVKSASKTNRILVVHEAVTFGGIGAEVAAQIQEEAFDYLDAPVLRVGAPFTPVPFSTPLEKAYVPDADRIVAGVRRLLERN